MYQQAFWLGFVTGLRSMLPLALLAWTSNTTDENSITPQKALSGLAAVGEIIGDKLPATPSRLSAGPLIGRLAIGATAGALLSRRFNQSPVQGAIRGAIGAALGSLAGYGYRTFASQLTDVPDVVWALIEDGAALGLGTLAVNRPFQER